MHITVLSCRFLESSSQTLGLESTYVTRPAVDGTGAWESDHLFLADLPGACLKAIEALRQGHP